MKEALKRFFEAAVKNDPALAMAYNEAKLTGCEKYIVSQAKKYLKGKSGAIEDSVVFKWARDFMYGDTESQETGQTDEEFFEENIPEYSVKQETVVRENKPAQKKKTLKQKVVELEQPTLFDFDEE